MTRVPGFRATIAAVGLIAGAAPARADATAFFGGLVSGGFQPVAGVSSGAFPRQTGSWVGFELEFVESRARGGRDISMFGGNLLVQSPGAARRLQYYGASGSGSMAKLPTTDTGPERSRARISAEG